MRKHPLYLTEKATLFLIDHDGSVGEFLCCRPGEDIFTSIFQAINLSVDEMSQAVVACASLRQSWYYDMLGMLMNARMQDGRVSFNGSIMYSLSTAKDQLQALLSNKSVSIEPFLSGDLRQDKVEKIHSYQLIEKSHKWPITLGALEAMLCRQLNNKKENLFDNLTKVSFDYSSRQQQIQDKWSRFLGEKDYFSDGSKFLPLLTQIHLTAAKLANKKIVVAFIDDIKRYAIQLHAIFSQNTWLLPANVELRPVHYSYHSLTKKTTLPSWLQNLTVQGTGTVCNDILCCAKQWADNMFRTSYESSAMAYQINPVGFIRFFKSRGFGDRVYPPVSPTPIKYASCLAPIPEGGGEALYSDMAITTFREQSSIQSSRRLLAQVILPSVKSERSNMAITTLTTFSEKSGVGVNESPRVTQKKSLAPINPRP